MRTIVLCLVLILALVSAVGADRPAMQAACAGAVNNASTKSDACGDPATNRIDAPIPIALGKFFQSVKIYPVVRVIGGDEKDVARAQSALSARLQKVAFACNFTKSEGEKVPAGSLIFTLTLVKDTGQSTSTTNRSSEDSWGSNSNRSGSYQRSESGSSTNSGETTYVGTDAGGELVLSEGCGSTITMASIADIFSGNAERTGSSYQDTSARNYYSSSRRWGSDQSQTSTSSGSSFRGDSEYSKSQSSRVTIAEAVEKAVFCVLAQGIDFYNLTYGLEPEVKEAVKTLIAEGYTGDPKYIAEYVATDE